MKKLASIFLALTLLAGLWVAPAAADDGNLVSYGTFDTYAEGRFTGWGAYYRTDSGYTSYQAHETIRGSRTNYGYCATLTQNGDYIQTSVENLTGGSVYEIAFDYQSLTDGRLEMMLSSRPADGSAVDYSYIYFPATGEEWGELSFKYTLPAESNIMQIAFRANASAGEDGEAVKIDEVSLRLTDGDENLGFENELAGWKVSGTAAVSEDAYSGAKSLKLSAGSTASKIVVTEGNTMDILGHVKAAAGATATVKATPIHKSSAFAATAETISVTSAAWKKAEFKTLASSADPNATLRVLFPVLLELSVTGEGEAYFDNFAVDSYTNLVQNGSFEQGTAGWKKERGKNPEGETPALSAYIISEGTVTEYGGAASAYDGANFIEITPTNAGTKINNVTSGEYVLIQSQNAISVSTDKQYKLSFAVNSRGSRAQIVVRFYDGDNAEISPIISINPVNDTVTDATYEWRKHDIVFTPPANTAAIKLQLYQSSALFTSTTNRFIQYDAISLCEIDKYTGFYDKAAMTASTSLAGIAGWLGQEVESLSAGKTFSFRFDNMNSASDKAFAVVGLFSKDAAGKKRLVKIYAMDELTRQGYTTEKGFDIGYKMDVTIAAEDLADTSMSYTLEAFAWEAGGSMKPVSAVAVLES